MIEKKKTKQVYKRFGDTETIQLRFLLEFLQAPNSSRLGLFADLYVCQHCGHLVILRKEDGDICHVTIDNDYRGVDLHDNQDHFFTKFRLKKQCQTITDGIEAGELLEDTVFRCTCNNPEPLDKDEQMGSIIDAFFLHDERQRKGTVLECNAHELLPRRPGPCTGEVNE